MTTKLITKFLSVQDELNKKLNPEWRKQGWAYPDAIMTETVECYNHLNWEWWRAAGRPIDWEQVKLELVDVAHFVFSHIIVKGQEKTLSEAVRLYDYKPLVEENAELLKINLKTLVKETVNCNFHADGSLFNLVYSFLDCLRAVGLTLDQFYVLFIGKVCLNQLRWKNGYKKGVWNGYGAICPDHYIKNWDGVEDNVWLAKHAALLNAEDDSFKEKLSADLDAKYFSVRENLFLEKKNA